MISFDVRRADNEDSPGPTGAGQPNRFGSPPGIRKRLYQFCFGVNVDTSRVGSDLRSSPIST